MLAGILLWVGLLLLLFVSWHFSDVVIYPKTYSVEEVYTQELEKQRFDPAEFAQWPKEEVHIRSPYGYPLFGLFIPVEDAGKTVVIVHGITLNHIASVKYAGIFHKRGFNILMIDHRNHGHSGGPYTTFGFYEKHDLMAWIDWVFARCGAGCVVGTHGESLGAATVLQHAAIDSRVTFVIADCPYASADEEFAYRLKVEYHLPKFPLLPLASWITKQRTGFAFAYASPRAALPQIEAPVFFIHGKEDAYIPPEASITMYEAKSGKKKLYLVPDAAHAEAYVTDPETYDCLVGEFLTDIGID